MPAPTGGTPEIDTDRPHPARIYDYLLGGACNFAADREFAERILTAVPGAALAARINRDFLRRAVRYCLDQGVRQFLDLGSGIPTAGNVHEVAPGARVVYVDSDPIAVAHSEQVLREVDSAAAVLADIHDAEAVLGAPAARDLLDPREPIAVLAIAVLHFLPDAQAALDPYIAALPPGGFLALTHGTADGHPDGGAAKLYADNGTPGVSRTHAEVSALLTGLEVVPPGVVWTSQWRPEATTVEDPSASLAYAAVARRR